MNDIELELMAHRYLYYVLLRPVISDGEYDQMERAAREMLPADSPVNKPGSDREGDYRADWVARARILLSSAPHSWTK